jgi:hypothetical protein
MREKNIPLDKYHCHEILDRLSVFTDMIDAYALQHPTSKQYPELSDLIEDALDKLLDAYQVAVNLPILEDSDALEKSKPTNYNMFEGYTFSQIPPKFLESTRTDDLNI